MNLNLIQEIFIVDQQHKIGRIFFLILFLLVDPETNIETLGLDYSSTALISSVVAAREIVKLKQENEELKQRLAAIEEKLA